MDITSFIMGYNKGVANATPTLQEKTATANGEVTPDEGYDGLSKVTVNVAASGGTTRNIVAVQGSAKGTGKTLTITHGLGIVPDIIAYRVSTITLGTASQVCGLYFNNAMVDLWRDKVGSFGGLYAALGTGAFLGGFASFSSETTSQTFGGVLNANAQTFQVYSLSAAPISSSQTVDWYAIGGITG